ncbi:hypothetical protein B7P43_G05727 [Cryptotermes secundus]|uniref:Uncharacterized protein n=1 Tax=Cryptotermes secundus TaxID=105785 RepID=A0A2J7QU25_9NEOP|nr:hypothetical protein B7P43_G05727 [Cryptotermes secundus]
MTIMEKLKTLEKYLLQCHFSHQESHMKSPRNNLWLQSEKPAFNCLKYGTGKQV